MVMKIVVAVLIGILQMNFLEKHLIADVMQKNILKMNNILFTIVI